MEKRDNVKKIRKIYKPNNCTASVDFVVAFYRGLKNKVFKGFPRGTTVDVIGFYTTFSYLQMKFRIVPVGSTTRALSILILCDRPVESSEVPNLEYLKSDFAIIDTVRNQTLGGVRVFEGDLNHFNDVLHNHVIPLVNKP